ncbi:MAG: acetate--CoA ligase family protein [Syntrophorhabdales bacterium]|jgi:acetyltransferase
MAERNIFAEMDPIFHPGSVAIIGATGKLGKVGRLFMARFVEAGFRELYAVNPGEREIMGIKSYPTVPDIPHPVDFAMILTPTDSALQAVRECAAKGVKTIVITTSGFAEAGRKGEELQREMVRVARSGGCRIIGPNCIGIYCPSSRLPYSLGQGMKSGSVGLVSQSGFFADYVTHRTTANGIYFSKAASCGNESDLTATDFLEYLGEDPETEMIIAYIEGLKDGRRFYNVCKKVSKKKPIILWKGGMTEGGARAAVSHTGAMAGSGATWEGVMRQAGIVSVKSFEEVFDCLHAFRLQPLPSGRRVGIVSAPGSTAVAATDVCLDLGLEVPKFSTRTTERLRKAMPPVGGSINNPIDLSLASAVNPRLHGDAIRILAEVADVDMILLIAIVGGELLRDIVLQATADIKTKKPLAVTEMVGTEESIGRDFPVLLSSGISVYSDGARAAKALSRLWEYARFRMRLPAAAQERSGSTRKTPATSGRDAQVTEKALRERRTVLSEHESKEVLRAYGIPVTKERETRDEREFREALEEIEFPLVIKASAPALAHKTEQGLVYPDIRNEQEAVAAFTQIMAKFKGEKPAILVQEMIRGSRELMVGLYRDEQFGPCVMFGLGGIFTEILKDNTFRVAPIDRQEALDMTGDIKARNIMGASRGMPAADVDQLADILIKVGAIGVDHPYVKEIDINPVILAGSKPVAVDALIVLSGQDEGRNER